jgi:hypothetical protein
VVVDFLAQEMHQEIATDEDQDINGLIVGQFADFVVGPEHDGNLLEDAAEFVPHRGDA